MLGLLASIYFAAPIYGYAQCPNACARIALAEISEASFSKSGLVGPLVICIRDVWYPGKPCSGYIITINTCRIPASIS